MLALWSSLPQSDYLARLGGDFLTPLARRFHKDPPAEETPIALVVIDETTHNSEPFSETPEVAWTPYFGEVIAAIESAGSLTYTSQRASAEAELAKHALAPIPDSAYKDAMITLADFSVQRAY